MQFHFIGKQCCLRQWVRNHKTKQHLHQKQRQSTCCMSVPATYQCTDHRQLTLGMGLVPSSELAGFVPSLELADISRPPVPELPQRAWETTCAGMWDAHEQTKTETEVFEREWGRDRDSIWNAFSPFRSQKSSHWQNRMKRHQDMSRHFGHVWALQCGCQGASCHCFDRRCCALAFASSWLWATLSYCICLILPYHLSPLSHLSCILLRIRICFILLIFAHLAAVFSTKSQPRGSGERLTHRRDECGGIWIIWYV